MPYDYSLWLNRSKRYEISPFWAAFSTFIFAPLGYWFNGDGFKGLKYGIIVFFAGYITLGIGTFIGSIILLIDVYRVSNRQEKRYGVEGGDGESSKKGWIIKGALMTIFFIFFYMVLFIKQLIPSE